MTVEVGILNKQGVALAADSAVTIGNGIKFYNTANKIFTLSKYNPVGIMIYDNVEVLGCPIEILIKEYRKQLKNTSFEYISDYSKNFLNYLKTSFSNTNNKNYYLYQVVSLINQIDNNIKSSWELIEDEMVLKDDKIHEEVIKNQLNNIIENIISEIYNIYSNFKDDIKFKEKEKEIRKECINDIKEIIESKIGVIHDNAKNMLIDICIMILTKKHNKGERSGIVIAGYGDKELYPSVESINFLGIFFGELKYTLGGNVSINDDVNASIIPFAQDDVINTFMTGIDDNMLYSIMQTVEKTKDTIKQNQECECNYIDKCFEKLKEEVEENIKDKSSKYWGPMLQTVAVAPKEELAHMAETLVNLTSFRRTLSMEEGNQSVGGPIDVALISKTDGFIWIKRKYYFNKQLNPGFFENYYS
ncbi:hypothetical protein KQI36_14650 [Clostridium senegalense]|uniref:hypothetical protein n=1 Tax=Clostridium senegalense TaxID=1465809 RepID=UPI001C10F8FA|nr:hypothetical protein [Clostridium senegalense]MBU5227870.1 hypothetical protein [Clostridium senegalense]